MHLHKKKYLEAFKVTELCLLSRTSEETDLIFDTHPAFSLSTHVTPTRALWFASVWLPDVARIARSRCCADPLFPTFVLHADPSVRAWSPDVRRSDSLHAAQKRPLSPRCVFWVITLPLWNVGIRTIPPRNWPRILYGSIEKMHMLYFFILPSHLIQYNTIRYDTIRYDIIRYNKYNII